MEALAGLGIFIAALLALLATGLPVSFATGLIAIVGTALFLSPDAISQLATLSYSQSSHFVLTVVPLFILMGEALAATGIGRDLFHAAQLWLRRIPGALAVSTVFACTGFAAVCGSSAVTAATIGAMSVPEMMKRGYDRRLAVGSAAAGGTLGILIPPSVVMIVYGVLTETSIGDLFIAGLLPGLMLSGLLSTTIVLLVLHRPSMAPAVTEPSSLSERMHSLKVVGPVMALASLVLGSIYLGIATPTEAGAVGAAGALLIAVLGGDLRWPVFTGILAKTVKTTAMFMLLLISGFFASFMLARLGIPQGMADLLLGLDVPRWMLIVLIMLLMVLMGMFMDALSVVVIMVPIFFPTILKLGYDPVWFGIIITINVEIAAISPPIGFNLFVLRSIVPGIDYEDVVRGSLIFILPLLLGILALIMFPEIALFLPRQAH